MRIFESLMNLLPRFEPAGQVVHVHEAVGETIDRDEGEWRPLTGDSKRDLTPMTQRRMQELAVYLWESNLLANRIIELPVAYLLAEGVRLNAADETVQEVIDKFWNDPINCMSLKLVKKVRELSLFGEQCWPTFVNEFSGRVRLGYLDPSMIETVVIDPDNGEQPIGIVTVKNKHGIARRYRVIINGSEDDLFTQRTRQIRESFEDGECFYFCINDLSNGSRGRSDLLSQTDWLDAYDQFLFGESDRVQFLRAFMWDVTLTGATADEVKAKARTIRPPSPGSVRVHNDSETWKAETPTINADDTDAVARLFRNHCLGGATIPEHWFGGGGDVNRSTAEDMAGPTFKNMSMRQTYIGYMLIEVGKYVIRQWEFANNQQEPDLSDEIYGLEASFPELASRDVSKYAAALVQVTMAVSQGIDKGLLTKEKGLELIESIAGRLGVSFDADEELEKVGEVENAAEEGDLFDEVEEQAKG